MNREAEMALQIRESHLRAYMAGQTLITPIELRAIVRASVQARDRTIENLHRCILDLALLCFAILSLRL